MMSFSILAMIILWQLMVNQVKASIKIPSQQIAPGVFMPMAGLGTGGKWAGNESVVEDGVAMALKLGVRLIDTSLDYGTQRGVARCIARSGVPSGELFITTKVPGGLDTDAVIAAHDENLKQLGVASVALLLVHFPCDFDTDPPSKCSKSLRQATWKGLEAVHKAGKARAIGVSHYCQRQLEDILEIATVPISINQQEWHVGMGPDPEKVVSFCRAHNITYQSFMSLGRGSSELITGPLVTSIGKAHNVTGAQISLRWCIQQGSPVIPQSNNPEHLVTDLDLFSWSLTEDEMKQLNAATSPPSLEPVSADCAVPFTEYV